MCLFLRCMHHCNKLHKNSFVAEAQERKSSWQYILKRGRFKFHPIIIIIQWSSSTTQQRSFVCVMFQLRVVQKIPKFAVHATNKGEKKADSHLAVFATTVAALRGAVPLIRCPAWHAVTPGWRVCGYLRLAPPILNTDVFYPQLVSLYMRKRGSHTRYPLLQVQACLA